MDLSGSGSDRPLLTGIGNGTTGRAMLALTEVSPMRSWSIVFLLALMCPTAASARMRCPDWEKLGPAEKSQSVEGMIEGHLSSNKSQRYTNANRVSMRRCLEANVGRIVDDIDDACSRSERSQDPVDDTFDRYLLSCVN